MVWQDIESSLYMNKCKHNNDMLDLIVVISIGVRRHSQKLPSTSNNS